MCTAMKIDINDIDFSFICYYSLVPTMVFDRSLLEWDMLLDPLEDYNLVERYITAIVIQCINFYNT